MKLLEDLENPTFQARTKGIGVLKLEDAVKLGATGPVLRASGMKTDVRKDDPYGIYDRLNFDIPVLKEGDAYARFRVGIMEIEESTRIIKQALNKLPKGEIMEPSLANLAVPYNLPEGEVYVRQEAARGEAAIYMVSDGGTKPYRCKVRGPSFSHLLPVLEHLLPGAQIADVPVIYWSLNPCPADMDR